MKKLIDIIMENKNGVEYISTDGSNFSRYKMKNGR